MSPLHSASGHDLTDAVPQARWRDIARAFRRARKG